MLRCSRNDDTSGGSTLPASPSTIWTAPRHGRPVSMATPKPLPMRLPAMQTDKMRHYTHITRTRQPLHPLHLSVRPGGPLAHSHTPWGIAITRGTRCIRWWSISPSPRRHCDISTNSGKWGAQRAWEITPCFYIIRQVCVCVSSTAQRSAESPSDHAVTRFTSSRRGVRLVALALGEGRRIDKRANRRSRMSGKGPWAAWGWWTRSPAE